MAVKQYRSACPLDCFDVCSLVVTVEEGKIVKIEGNKEHPYTRGFICEKGKKHLDRIYSPLRLKYPMKKEKGEWTRISWNEAYDMIADKLEGYIKHFGTQSIAHYYDGGAGGLLKNIEDYFFDYLGGITEFTGSLCWSAGINAQQADFGAVLGHSPADMSNSKTIVLWGKNPSDTHIHFMPWLKKARDNGARVILIDPIKTATMSYCDEHIQIKAAGDCAFACGVAKHIIEQNLFDNEFVEKHSKGFDSLKSYLLALDMRKLSEQCGVEESVIESFAEALALQKPVSIHVGYGLQRYFYGGATVRSIDMLGALTGNIGIAGGGVNYANKASGQYIDLDALKIDNNSPSRYIEKPLFGKLAGDAQDPPIKAIFISKSNPMVQLPDTNAAVKAFEVIEFKVVIDHFMTDTAALADLVLPPTYFLEEEDIIASGMWNGHIFHNSKCVDRYHDTKPEFEIFTELAHRMGFKDFPSYNEKEWISLLLKPLAELGLDMKELEEKSYVLSPANQELPWNNHNFLTESGKFEFIQKKGLEGYFRYMDERQRYNYRLLTVHARESLHSQHFIDNEAEYPVVYISKADGCEMKIHQDELVRLCNDKGEIKAKVCLTESCQPGTVYMKEGWWIKSGGSVNKLTPEGISDIGRQAVYNECRCNIYRD